MLLRLQRQLPELRLEGLALSYQDGLSHGKGEYVGERRRRPVLLNSLLSWPCL